MYQKFAQWQEYHLNSWKIVELVLIPLGLYLKIMIAGWAYSAPSPPPHALEG